MANVVQMLVEDARIGEERNVESRAGGKMGPNKREGLLKEDQ